MVYRRVRQAGKSRTSLARQPAASVAQGHGWTHRREEIETANASGEHFDRVIAGDVRRPPAPERRALPSSPTLGAHDFYRDWDRIEEFRQHWARHDVRFHISGIKHFRHIQVGELELNYERLELVFDTGLTIFTYTGDPGARSAEALGPARHPRRHDRPRGALTGRLTPTQWATGQIRSTPRARTWATTSSRRPRSPVARIAWCDGSRSTKR